MKDKGGIEMKKIVAGILAAVIHHNNTGDCAGTGTCYTDSDHDGVCDNYQNKICNNAEGHHMHHQNSGCRGGRNR